MVRIKFIYQFISVRIHFSRPIHSKSVLTNFKLKKHSLGSKSLGRGGVKDTSEVACNSSPKPYCKDSIPKIQNNYSQKWNWNIDRSQRHECGNLDWGRAIPFPGMHKFKYLCSATRPTAQFLFGEYINSNTFAVRPDSPRSFFSGNTCKSDFLCSAARLTVQFLFGECINRIFFALRPHSQKYPS